MGDSIDENRDNVLQIMELLQFPLDLPGIELKVVADFKMLVILVGLNSCGARHPCIFCEVWHFSILRISDKLIFFARALEERWSRESGHIPRRGVDGDRDNLELLPVVSNTTMSGGAPVMIQMIARIISPIDGFPSKCSLLHLTTLH